MKPISRRNFLGQASCAGLGYMTFMNSFLNLKALNAAAISNATVNDCSGYKAIVCILFAGGCDSYNMLAPWELSRHMEYVATRSGLAIPRNELLRLKAGTPGHAARDFAVHPSMPEVRDLFDQNKMAFLANTGTLLNNTTTKATFNSGTDLPIGLFSHSDQIQQWQTGIPSVRSSKGWAGRMADIIGSCNANQNISMNLSLSGTNIFQTGNETIEYALDPFSGSVGIDNYDPNSTWNFRESRTQAIDSLLAQQYQNIFDKSYMDVIMNAKDAHVEFQAALQNSVEFDPTLFPDTYFGSSLEMIAKTIDVKDDLDFNRQVFYIVYGGWDHHDELLNNQTAMLGEISQGLSAFMTGLEQIGHEDDVLTMTISEFGRTLASNGNGSDHAWGGNAMVMGGPNLINGGQIYGDYPSLALNTDIELGRGVLIPQQSTDEYFAEVAKWFGVTGQDLDIIFPNLHEFYSSSSSDNPIGFLQ